MRFWTMIILLSCSFSVMAQGLVWGGQSDTGQRSGVVVIAPSDSSNINASLSGSSGVVVTQSVPQAENSPLFDETWHYSSDIDKYFVYIPGDCQLGVQFVCVNDFMIGAYEVTNHQFAEFSSAHYSGDHKGMDLSLSSLPVVNVTVEQAQRYAQWLSQETGKKFRLPTISEWQKASMSLSLDDYACLYGNFSARESDLPVRRGRSAECDVGIPAAASVGSLEPTDNGLYDIYGNVSEWVCQRENVEQCVNDSAYVAVGGSWMSSPSDSAVFSGKFSKTVGFRLVQDL